MHFVECYCPVRALEVGSPVYCVLEVSSEYLLVNVCFALGLENYLISLNISRQFQKIKAT